MLPVVKRMKTGESAGESEDRPLQPANEAPQSNPANNFKLSTHINAMQLLAQAREAFKTTTSTDKFIPTSEAQVKEHLTKLILQPETEPRKITILVLSKREPCSEIGSSLSGVPDDSHPTTLRVGMIFQVAKEPKLVKQSNSKVLPQSSTSPKPQRIFRVVALSDSDLPMDADYLTALFKKIFASQSQGNQQLPTELKMIDGTCETENVTQAKLPSVEMAYLPNSVRKLDSMSITELPIRDQANDLFSPSLPSVYEAYISPVHINILPCLSDIFKFVPLAQQIRINLAVCKLWYEVQSNHFAHYRSVTLIFGKFESDNLLDVFCKTNFDRFHSHYEKEVVLRWNAEVLEIPDAITSLASNLTKLTSLSFGVVESRDNFPKRTIPVDAFVCLLKKLGNQLKRLVIFGSRKALNSIKDSGGKYEWMVQNLGTILRAFNISKKEGAFPVLSELTIDLNNRIFFDHIDINDMTDEGFFDLSILRQLEHFSIRSRGGSSSLFHSLEQYAVPNKDLKTLHILLMFTEEDCKQLADKFKEPFLSKIISARVMLSKSLDVDELIENNSNLNTDLSKFTIPLPALTRLELWLKYYENFFIQHAQEKPQLFTWNVYRKLYSLRTLTHLKLKIQTRPVVYKSDHPPRCSDKPSPPPLREWVQLTQVQTLKVNARVLTHLDLEQHHFEWVFPDVQHFEMKVKMHGCADCGYNFQDIYESEKSGKKIEQYVSFKKVALSNEKVIHCFRKMTKSMVDHYGDRFISLTCQLEIYTIVGCKITLTPAQLEELP